MKSTYVPPVESPELKTARETIGNGYLENLPINGTYDKRSDFEHHPDHNEILAMDYMGTIYSVVINDTLGRAYVTAVSCMQNEHTKVHLLKMWNHRVEEFYGIYIAYLVGVLLSDYQNM